MFRPKMAFGRYRGQYLESIPTEYLRWVLTGCANADDGLRADIQIELVARTAHRIAEQARVAPSPQKPVPAGVSREFCREIVIAGRRALASRHHPDRGGNLATMQNINVTADWLETLLREVLP